MRSALFGVGITAVFVSYQLLTGLDSPVSRNPALMLVFVVLCPPSLLSLAIDKEVGTNAFYVLWTVIALLNAALFATVRTLLARRAQRPD